MRRDLIHYLESETALSGAIFSYPVPAEECYPYAVLSLDRQVPRNEYLDVPDLDDWFWVLTIWGKSLIDIESAKDEMRRKIHRPGQRFELGNLLVGSCRVVEISEQIEVNETGGQVASGYEIKFKMTTEMKGE